MASQIRHRRLSVFFCQVLYRIRKARNSKNRQAYIGEILGMDLFCIYFQVIIKGMCGMESGSISASLKDVQKRLSVFTRSHSLDVQETTVKIRNIVVANLKTDLSNG